jgi:hypothetical protein
LFRAGLVPLSAVGAARNSSGALLAWARGPGTGCHIERDFGVGDGDGAGCGCVACSFGGLDAGALRGFDLPPPCRVHVSGILASLGPFQGRMRSAAGSAAGRGGQDCPVWLAAWRWAAMAASALSAWAVYRCHHAVMLPRPAWAARAWRSLAVCCHWSAASASPSRGSGAGGMLRRFSSWRAASRWGSWSCSHRVRVSLPGGEGIGGGLVVAVGGVLLGLPGQFGGVLVVGVDAGGQVGRGGFCCPGVKADGVLELGAGGADVVFGGAEAEGAGGVVAGGCLFRVVLGSGSDGCVRVGNVPGLAEEPGLPGAGDPVLAQRSGLTGRDAELVEYPGLGRTASCSPMAWVRVSMASAVARAGPSARASGSRVMMAAVSCPASWAWRMAWWRPGRAGAVPGVLVGAEPGLECVVEVDGALGGGDLLVQVDEAGRMVGGRDDQRHHRRPVPRRPGLRAGPGNRGPAERAGRPASRSAAAAGRGGVLRGLRGPGHQAQATARYGWHYETSLRWNCWR